ncbi:MAG: hypothetical protein M3552_03740, partial [Planctomycetota bacterium]|nr:hypothetical protein [Planctomycetota bacterium]
EPSTLGDITPGRNGHRLSGESRLPSDDEILAERERAHARYQRTYATESGHAAASTADTARDLYKLVRKMKKSEPAEVAVKQKKAKRADKGEGFDFAGLASELGGKVIPGIVGVIFVCFAAYWISSSVMSGGRGLPELGKVSGVVTLDGEPLGGATVMFMPSAESDAEADAASRISSSVGMTDEKGRYSLMYVKDVAGAAVGKHQVIINAPKPNGAEALPRKYNTASELTFEVKPGSNEAPFELVSK